VADAAEDTAGVRIPPPLLYLVPLGIGIFLNGRAPKPFLKEEWRVPAGALLVLLSLVMLAALAAFARAKTHPEPWRPARALVIRGPYRFTRNPMYIGMALLCAGIACWMNALWALLGVPLSLLAVRLYVIRREEAYLTRRFGDEYLAYKARVRRWL
jgi:protein-S-isoprenylcysteine O-methyltransferase Ste14